MDCEVYPEGIYDLLQRVHKDYGPIPLQITENGAAYEDTVVDGKVEDEERRSYLERHFAQCLRAIEDGVPLEAYFVWSLLDNFEWAWGYDRRFGIIYVDFATQERIMKRSALWFKDFLRTQR
jgi:beta-glucosidase